jgi:hypothetical protein
VLGTSSVVLGDLRRLAQEKMAREQAARRAAAEKLLEPDEVCQEMFKS